MPDTKSYYDGEYWNKDVSPPEQDPTTEERWGFLQDTLTSKGIGNGANILDLGCGHGLFTKRLSEKGYSVTGVDISERAIEKARKLCISCEFMVHSVEKELPLEDNSFELVWPSEVIEHLFDVKTYLEEVNRLLKPGGLFVLTTPYHGLLKNILIVLTNFDGHFCKSLRGGTFVFSQTNGLKKHWKNLVSRSLKSNIPVGFGPFLSQYISLVGR